MSGGRYKFVFVRRKNHLLFVLFFIFYILFCLIFLYFVKCITNINWKAIKQCQDIAEILLKLKLNTNQSINQSMFILLYFRSSYTCQRPSCVWFMLEFRNNWYHRRSLFLEGSYILFFKMTILYQILSD